MKIKLDIFFEKVKNYLKKILLWICGLFVVALVLMIISAWAHQEKKCGLFGTITEVGGCDLFGNCTVSVNSYVVNEYTSKHYIIDEGIIGIVSKPVKGQTVCLKSYFTTGYEGNFTNFWSFTFGRLGNDEFQYKNPK